MKTSQNSAPYFNPTKHLIGILIQRLIDVCPIHIFGKYQLISIKNSIIIQMEGRYFLSRIIQ